MVIIRPVDELKRAIREEIREELTSGDVSVNELTNAILKVIRDRLPASLTASGNLKTAILEDMIGIAKDSTLATIGNRLPSSLTTAGNFKVAVTEDLVGLAKSSDLKNLANLDLALSYMWKLLRWGRNVNPFWVHGSEVTAPSAGTSLASVTVSSNKNGYIYGFYISSGEANDFKINWISGGTSYSVRIVFPSKGSVSYIDITPINEGLPADPGTTVTITNVNAGSSGVVYQARIFYAEL